MLEMLAVVLVRPRFPENIGMAARAMGNMGAGQLILVSPERWEYDKACALATSQGKGLLDNVRVTHSLEEALSPFHAAFGTTARTGGWRREVILPEQAASEARSCARHGGRVALVFGPEDKGLCNAETEQCTRLVTVPTCAAHSSLNLAQAVLLLLYECAKADREKAFAPEQPRSWSRPGRIPDSRRVTLAEEALLLRTLESTLVDIEYLPADNPGWFMLPLRRFLRKGGLRRHEFDMLMGMCRKVRRLAPRREE